MNRADLTAPDKPYVGLGRVNPVLIARHAVGKRPDGLLRVMPGWRAVPADEVMLEQHRRLMPGRHRACWWRWQPAGDDCGTKIAPVQLMNPLGVVARQLERRLKPAQGLQAEPAAAERPAHPVLECPGEPGIRLVVRARLVQVLSDDHADGVLPDLVRTDIAGMLLPCVPVWPRPEHQLPKVQSSGPLATCVSFVLGHQASSELCDSHATGGR